MNDDLDRLNVSLARRFLGKQGIHGLNVDKDTRTVNVYVDDSADPHEVQARLRKHCGDLKIRAIRSPPARLA